MFSILKKKKSEEVKIPVNLTKREQKQIKEIVQKARNDDGVPRTAQQSIPFQRMFPDGICRVRDNYYTKTIQFQDINYQLAQQEDKTAIFEEWCSFLNFFDSSIHFELSFMNMSTDADSFEKSIRIPYRKDEFNPIRTEYSQIWNTKSIGFIAISRKFCGYFQNKYVRYSWNLYLVTIPVDYNSSSNRTLLHSAYRKKLVKKIEGIGSLWQRRKDAIRF